MYKYILDIILGENWILVRSDLYGMIIFQSYYSKYLLGPSVVFLCSNIWIIEVYIQVVKYFRLTTSSYTLLWSEYILQLYFKLSWKLIEYLTFSSGINHNSVSHRKSDLIIGQFQVAITSAKNYGMKIEKKKILFCTLRRFTEKICLF